MPNDKINGEIRYTGTGGEKKLNLNGAMTVTNGKLGGTVLGEIKKDGTGRIDNFEVSVNNFPFELDIKGSSVEMFTVMADRAQGAYTVTGCSKTYEELKEFVDDGKFLIARVWARSGIKSTIFHVPLRYTLVGNRCTFVGSLVYMDDYIADDQLVYVYYINFSYNEGDELPFVSEFEFNITSVSRPS